MYNVYNQVGEKDMKITDIKTYIVGVPSDRRPYKLRNNWLFVKVITDEGLIGWGECVAPGHRKHTLVQLIKELGEEVLIGKTNPFNIEKLWKLFHESGGTANHFSRHGGMLASQAMAAIEMACWDIMGKAVNQPVYNLLGGVYNEKLRSYTYMHYWWKPGESPEKAGEVAAELVEEGFTALKVEPHYPIVPQPREISLEQLKYAEDVVRNIREAVGNKCDILIGTHGQWTTYAAIRLAKRIEQYDPLWFEEPVPLENKDEMARVAQSTSIPIATGERLVSKWEFLSLLEKQAAQIIQVNVGLNGIMESKKIAAMAEAHYAQIAPWMHNGPIAGSASIQLSVCSPNFLIQEGIGKWDDLEAEILKEPVKWENGYIIPSTKPGLGVEIDENVLVKYPEIS